MLDWLASIPQSRVFVSVLTLAEIDQGIEALALSDGRRTRYAEFRLQVEAQFVGRILPLDDDTVRLWGALSGRWRREASGRAPIIDTMLLATAQRRGLIFATRNVADVRGFGEAVFDPWNDDPAAFPIER